MELHAGPASHPECPQRHAAIVTRLQEEGLVDCCRLLVPSTVSREQVLRAHSVAHLDELARLYDSDGPAVQGKGDLFWNRHTDEAARLSAGCAVAATLAVARGEVDSAFAVIRPPGHHAECDRAMGFCFLCNASIAALAALEECSDTVKRVVILDWDVHHGNGIEVIHYEDARVLYISLHRYSVDPESWFYPGTGAVDDSGKGAGLGFNVNIPWPERGLNDADYMAAFELVVEPIVRAFGPDLVLISAGYDAARGDPLGGMCLSPEAYHHMTARLVACQPRCVALLEGGYNLQSTAVSAAATLRGLLRHPAPPLSSRPHPKLSTERVLQAVVDHQMQHWPQLGSEEHLARLNAHFAAAQAAALQLKPAVRAPRTPAPGKRAPPAVEAPLTA